METYYANGTTAESPVYETPFADIQPVRELGEQAISSEDFFSNFLQEAESPFSRTYEATPSGSALTEATEQYVNLLSELNNAEFGETLYELANEAEDSWRNKVSDEIAMGDRYIPFATQQAKAYFEPMIRESENMIDTIAQHFSGASLADHSEAELESFFSNLEFDHSAYTPAQEQFFGKLFNKVKSVVKSGINLAKKGIAAVGKILPIGMVLDKIKGLIRPLLNKVLKFAIGKLPVALQPFAQKLAAKFLNLETSQETVNENLAGNDESGNELEAIQTELDNHLAQLLFSADETTAQNLVMEYETSFEAADREQMETTGFSSEEPAQDARQKFINELKELPQGESPAPAIERFLPLAIKMGITLIGRPKVVNFIAGLLAKLVSKYVPANIAKPLATSIVDIGLSAIGFEVNEAGNAELGYEAIANTIQETVQNLSGLDEATINNSEALTMNLLEAFEVAAANNFPSQYIKEEFRVTKQKGLWVRMPRNQAVQLYKKFTHVFNITIEPRTASAVTTFRSLPLASFLADKYGLDPSKPIRAKVHLYETLRGTRLSAISRFEKLPGLNAKQPRAWIQLLPLTKQAASLLLSEPGLGKDPGARNLSSRYRNKGRQRFYYLEIEGARLRIPRVDRSEHKHRGNGQPAATTEARSADIQAVINFIKSEIRVNYYFSEEDAKSIVEKLNKNDILGAAMAIKQSIKTVLNDILQKNISTKVKIVHEAMPELYLEYYEGNQEQFSVDSLGKWAGRGILSKLIEKITEKISSKAYDAIVGFFKERATEFKTAQAAPQDGVTIKLVWSNVPGMSVIRTIINAVQGNLSIGSLSDLSLPSLSVPEITIVADKKFD